MKEINVIQQTFGGCVINLTVSQPGLDPQSSIYSSDYRAELLEAPCRADSPDGRKAWAEGMQSLIDSIRSDGADIILLRDGLGFAQHTNDLERD